MAERRQGQAAAGEISQGRAATYEHGEGAAAEVAADLFDGIKEMVVTNLMPSTVWALEFTQHAFPTISNVGILAAEHTVLEARRREDAPRAGGHFASDPSGTG